MSSSNEQTPAAAPTRPPYSSLLASAMDAIRDLSEVPGRDEGRWSKRRAIPLLVSLFDTGDQEAVDLAMKFIEHLKITLSLIITLYMLY